MTRLFFGLLATLGVIACGSDDPGATPEEGPEEAAPTEAPEDSSQVSATDAAPLRQFLAEQAGRGPGTFPHGAHADVSCNTCHEVVASHTTHQQLDCAECHGADTTEGVPPAEDCLSCHHAPDQAVGCQSCHASLDGGSVERPVRLTVWTESRMRVLPFDHQTHATQDCVSCHEERPQLAASAECASCHQDHHREEATCATCHLPTTQEAHELEAHEGCGGAGCHTDAAMASVPPLGTGRSLCLVCHQDQTAHEPQRECGFCHQVGSLNEEPIGASTSLGSRP